ncbi:hypothetical protein ACFSO7_12155 [Bacillus sp. CGMCC 1.16607]|uniref:hypothetical protein n=1 Tax=Bacillus sp. CGMCC 1.16607 TaxID=3351842 RepID=UPI0036309640
MPSQSSNRKISASINLEKWMWDFVSKIEPNRTKFFRQLFLDYLTQELKKHFATDPNFQVNELYAHLYKLTILKEKKRGLLYKKSRSKRGTNEKSEKIPISVSLEAWIWELAAEIGPNRSHFFKLLLLKKINDGLMEAGYIKENTEINKVHGDVYISMVLKDDLHLTS